MNAIATTSTNALRLPGTDWPEQGGIIAAIMPAQGEHPAYYLIVPTAPESEATDELTWGPYGTKIAGLSDWDGKSNTFLLTAAETKHPAAEFCSALTIGEHNDFYLPSRREASLAAGAVPHLFAKGLHWTSSQYSAYIAFVQGFSGGYQGDGDKDVEWRVRAVRRFLID